MALRYISAPEINNFVICIESLSSFFFKNFCVGNVLILCFEETYFDVRE